MNLHLHLHLKDCILDYGPPHAFWPFRFERFNSLLESYFSNKKVIEEQIMRKFCKEQAVHDLSSQCNEDILRHMVVCCAAKKVVHTTRVLFTQTEKLPISTSRSSKTTEPISTKFIYFMPSIYLTSHTKFDGDRASSSQDMRS